MKDAASWKAVERKARLAGNGLRPCPEAQHHRRPRSRSFLGACNQGQPPAPRAASIHQMLGPDSFQGACNQGQPPAPRAASIHRMLGPDSPKGSVPEDSIRRYSP